ncbi:hypothetical protein DFJ58DRAFT_736430 [Suillus subalutaceus]|uniref:uncharacterized protein n=1 Tax=Suillus subalutaceus TaxID=48586 RepID=UPI001B878544|nr:uncharacterized protein DFJ58DRAFT_736430 [Suillus subalutaceus]KAG1832265.1 hypothetical protein DFJ58DRAFT_736430 [Suillus subalutaceus]
MNEGKKPSFKIPEDHVSLSKERSEDTGDDQDGIWTTIHKKRAVRTHEVTRKRAHSQNLTQEQANLVKKAETQLTDSSESHEAGPSKDKGKVPDPRNWGNANLSNEDVDLEAQCAALALYRAA